jgi:RNA polymerase sigma-54 factor
MGESTLSRLIKDRYMNTPIGVIKIKDLFSSSVGNHASKSVKQIISEIIHQETKALSDQKITNLLIEKNITISRRTVTKYREALKIPCARHRIHSSI